TVLWVAALGALTCSWCLAAEPRRTTLVRPPEDATGERVVRLDVAESSANDIYARIFTAPVACNGEEADFAVHFAGTTRFSESFAEQCRLEVVPEKQLDK